MTASKNRFKSNTHKIYLNRIASVYPFKSRDSHRTQGKLAGFKNHIVKHTQNLNSVSRGCKKQNSGLNDKIACYHWQGKLAARAYQCSHHHFYQRADSGPQRTGWKHSPWHDGERAPLVSAPRAPSAPPWPLYTGQCAGPHRAQFRKAVF